MKFAQLQKGTAARKTVSLRIRGETIPVDVRVLTPSEEIDAYAKAIEFARGKGTDLGADDSTVFKWAHDAHIALVACVDSESPADKPEPFFAGIDEVLSGHLCTADVAYLVESWEAWQDEHGGRVRTMTRDEAASAVIQLANLSTEDAAFFFASLRPGMRFSLARFMASQLVALPLDKSPLFSSQAAN